MNTAAKYPILEVDGLTTVFRLRSGVLQAVDGVSFSLQPGRVLCIVGESGSGKSVTALSIMRLIDRPGAIEGGRILFRGTDLLALSESEMDEIRGNRIGMIFQDPMTSLNPAFTIGEQIAESLVIHQNESWEAAQRRALELLAMVGIPEPADRYGDYPHQFSGGMRQRVMIAAAIACDPDVLIADEPTTALDVTIQAQILRLLVELQHRLDSAMIFITHDLGVVSALADDILVMYGGRAVESGPAERLLVDPRHPYTQGLLASVVELTDEPDSELHSIPGTPLVPIDLGPGCRFRDRCPLAQDVCRTEDPPMVAIDESRWVACHIVSGTAEARP
jgi:oligopeptide/dipeptide ABC transporter ATP-binding protein